MTQKNILKETQKNVRSTESYIYFNNKEWSDNDIFWNTDEKNIEQNPAFFLSIEVRAQLGNKIDTIRKDIISSWLQSREMGGFYKKYAITRDEADHYIGYFWSEKVLNYIINELRGNDDSNKEYIYISTKFLSFIRQKDLEIEDLLEMIISLKNTLIYFFLDENFETLHKITTVFDILLIDVSKSYNSVIIKLYNEHAEAIDRLNIISKTDIHGKIIAANDGFCELSGYTREELIGKSHNIVRHPDMSKEIFTDLWRTIQDKKVWKWTIKNLTKDGLTYWTESTVIPMLDEHNQIVEYISIKTDVTELREAYKNLEEYIEALNSTNMVLKLDKFWKIISANDIFLRMSLYKKDDLLGSDYISWIIWYKREHFEGKIIVLVGDEDIKEIQDYIGQGLIWKWLIKNKSKLGSFFWTSTSIVPIKNLYGEIVEYVVIQNDVTDLEIVHQKLKKALDKQKELDIKKDEFLNIASHELRTPMTSIKWYISMILDGDAGEINEEVKSFLIQAYKGSQRLLDLINDMLDISKIESGKQELNIQKIEIVALIKETEKEIQWLFTQKQQNFIVSIDFESFKYHTDENKLKQVLLNLLWNANKFTPINGTIHLNCQKIEKELVISIEDSGIGIDTRDFEKIFEKFWQVRNSLTRNINGTWLGLPIVKAIVEQMNGRMSIESKVWKGSTFFIHLPITK